MTAIARLMHSYSEPLPRLAAFVPLHLVIRLIAAAVLAPTTAGLMALGLAASGQPALSDQEIALFLLTPAGALAALAAASVAVAASVLDVAAMSVLLREGRAGGMSAAAAAVRALAGRFGGILQFCALLIARIVTIVAPFGAVVAVIAAVLLTEYDINYYLSVRPPALIVAAVLIVPVVTLCLFLLVRRLSGWAIALHLVMMGRVSAGQSFRRSAELLAGDRSRVALDVALWAASRVALLSVAALVAGLAMNGVNRLSGDALGVLAMAALAVLALWWLIDTACSALANAALAAQLNRLYGEAMGDLPVLAAPRSAGDVRRVALPLGAASVAAVLIVAVALLGADRLAARADEMQPVDCSPWRGCRAAGEYDGVHLQGR